MCSATLCVGVLLFLLGDPNNFVAQKIYPSLTRGSFVACDDVRPFSRGIFVHLFVPPSFLPPCVAALLLYSLSLSLSLLGGGGFLVSVFDLLRSSDFSLGLVGKCAWFRSCLDAFW